MISRILEKYKVSISGCMSSAGCQAERRARFEELPARDHLSAIMHYL